MMARTLVKVSAAIEAAIGVALIVNPGLVVEILLGVGVSGAGIAVGRVGGFGLLSLGLVCWPNGDDVNVRASWVLFLYDLLACLYLSWRRFHWLCALAGRGSSRSSDASAGAASVCSDFSVEDCLT
jgi:hypothetical protein